MNRDEFEQKLAEYLGNELDPAERVAFEQELMGAWRGADRADPAGGESPREVVNALLAARERIRENLVYPEAAEDRAAHISLPRGSPSAAARRRRLVRVATTALRYAAVFLIAFGAGYLVHGRAVPSSVAAAPVANVEHAGSPPLGVSPRLAENFERVTRSYPQLSTFERSLITLAPN
jgi:hypothetical protein